MVNDLIDWTNDSIEYSLDAVIVAGIFHKQFVIIHPFMDGNGRTARLLTKILLAQLGLDLFSLVSFENFYNQNVTRYFRAVGVQGNYYDIKDGIDFTSWLEYFAEGIIDELLRVRREVKSRLMNTGPRLKPHHQLILDYIHRNGTITIGEYGELTDRGRSTRAKDLGELVDMGLIERVGKTRAVYYRPVSNQ